MDEGTEEALEWQGYRDWLRGNDPASSWDVWRASARAERKRIADLAANARNAKRRWLESYGVPISQEFADFAEAIGLLINAADPIPTDRIQKGE